MGNFKIDKSAFTEADLAEWDRLIAKGAVKVDPEAAKEKMEDEKPEVPAETKPEKKAEEPPMEETKKSAPEVQDVPEFVKSAIAKSEEFMTRIEKQEMSEIAKKYAILGEKPEELGEKLYELKKSSPDMYNTCIAMLDNQVQMLEKSGMFDEVGKSAGAHSTTGGAVAKAEAKAKEIQKADPSVGWSEAIAKAWEDPALMAEYDAEYYGR